MSKMLPPDATLPSAVPTGGSASAPVLAEPADFREGMSRLATGVAIVATGGPAGIAGVTATALASVSDAPPTLLVCLQRRSQSAARLLANGVFSVNVLAGVHRDLADIFAGRTGLHLEDRFSHGSWAGSSFGVPVLEGAGAVFVCRLSAVSEVATHHVLFGEVAEVLLGPAGTHLVHADRTFRAL